MRGRGTRGGQKPKKSKLKAPTVRLKPTVLVERVQPSGLEPLKLAFVRGVAPDKWRERWLRVPSRGSLQLMPLTNFETAPEPTADITLVRLPQGASFDHALVHAVLLYTEALALIVPRDHELAKAPAASADDLELLTFVAYPQYDTRWPAPISYADPAWEPKNIRAALALVTAGLGATIVPGPLARSVINKHEHAVVPITAELAPTSIYAVWPLEGDSDRVQELIGVLRGRGANSSR